MAFADGIADFRSDTVTRPTPEMRRAMAEAEVGDDVYGDDPTVNLLQEEAAAAVGKASAIFVPTGTMGNQLSLMVQTRPGDDVLCDEGAHVRNIEKGAASAFSGVSFRPVHAPGGWIQPNQIDAVMATAGRFFPRIRLMVWENSHNLSGGRVIPVEGVRAGNEAARRHGLSVHFDGARIFNAAAALDVEADELADGCDTVTFCFSKGLGAPVGSVICGSTELIEEIHYLRKRMGGGMRQVGVLAAPARIALRDRHRLGEDHALARYLAEQIADHAPDALDPKSVETNIVNVAVDHLPVSIEAGLTAVRANGMLVNPPLFGGVWRLVTHRDLDRSDVDRLVTTLFHAGQ
ncbi:MAG TPA: GntG family PLP-dependent aldolase [Acidimicrobiia bacterium]|nr:GntG family PLP-dependent aldolase [Acidimicrobiia bacterium]